MVATSASASQLWHSYVVCPRPVTLSEADFSQVGDALLTTINQAMNVDKDTMVRAQQADNSSNK